MPKNIFVDLNVILDVLLARGDYTASKAVIGLGAKAENRACISAHMVTTFAYLLEAAAVPRPEIQWQINWLLAAFNIIAVDGRLLKAALNSQLRDFEDAVIEQAAGKAGAAVIVTNNVKDFKDSIVKAQTPAQFLRSAGKNT